MVKLLDKDKDACPVGSTPDNSASAKTDCQGKAGVQVKEMSGNISAACVQSKEYAVKCVVMPKTCQWGAKTLTRDKLECAEAPAAGSSTAPASGSNEGHGK
jgi:hypothetical protein